MADKDNKRTAIVRMGGIIIGHMDATGAFVPNPKQPPATIKSDFRSVERWLVSEGVVGEHVLVRAYTKNIVVGELRKYVSSLS